MDNQQLFPVTEETFSQVWAHVDTLRCKARVKAMIAKIGGFLSNLFLLFGILFLVNGLIYTHFTGSYVRFLKSLPFFLPLWEPLSSLVSSDAAIYVNGLKLLALDYLVSALVFALLSMPSSIMKRTPPNTSSYTPRPCIWSATKTRRKSSSRKSAPLKPR